MSKRIIYIHRADLNYSPHVYHDGAYIEAEMPANVSLDTLVKDGCRLVPKGYDDKVHEALDEMEAWAAQFTPLSKGNTHLVNAIELLRSLKRSDYRPVEKKTDPPKPEELSPAPLAFPKTPQEADNLLSCLSTGFLGKVVGQLLASGRVTSGQSLTLLQRLPPLEREFDTFRQALRRNLADELRRADEAVSEKK